MAEEQGKAPKVIDEAIAFCLEQQDKGTVITPGYLLETFPDLHSELVDFFDDEDAILGSHRFAKTSLTNRTISQFELQNLIGKGSFGEVWRAWDTSLRREVAIKVPRDNQVDSRDAARFLREARAASKLSHPNIVRVLEVGTSDEIPFICSELVDGIPLSEWATKLRSEDPTGAVRRIAKVTSRIASAMAHAHELGVIHRDLNPRNIMMASNDTPKVLDFGVAKSQMDASTVTIHGEVLGTPAYVSPEQAGGSLRELDGRSDIFSIGVILYEMLTGKRPFRGDLKLLLHQIRFDAPASPRSLATDVSEELELVCLKCLEKAPGDRYQSASDLETDLEKVLSGDQVNISLRKTGLSETSRTWLIAVSMAALLLISVLAIQAFAPPRNDGVTDGDASAEQGEGASGVAEQDDASQSPAQAYVTSEMRASMIKQRRKYHVDQIEDLVERMIKGFDRHLASQGGAGESEQAVMRRLSEFEQETNRLKQKYSSDDDWQTSVQLLVLQQEKIRQRLETVDIGNEAHAFWMQLRANVNGLHRIVVHEAKESE